VHHVEHRPEDLLLRDGHLRVDSIEDRRAEEEALSARPRSHAAAIGHDLRAFLFTDRDEFLHAIAMLLRDH
jgi:hypothetical protein